MLVCTRYDQAEKANNNNNEKNEKEATYKDGCQIKGEREECVLVLGLIGKEATANPEGG